MMKKIIIMGAGAIGRGYLPWTLDLNKHALVFVDNDIDLISKLQTRESFSIFRVSGNDYQEKIVPIHSVYTSANFNAFEHRDATACFICVGPRNAGGVAELFLGTTIPLIVCENEPETVTLVRRTVGHDAVYFAVPDVITSNTASPELIKLDPLAIATECGVLYIETCPAEIYGDMVFISNSELLNVQWTAKMYLHNTPHCIAAYLGALLNLTHIHEVMSHPKAAAVINGSMQEMLEVLTLQGEISSEFLNWYADKELMRFQCGLLFDPISRVAREPLRKLELHGRLIGAALLCIKFGVRPTNLLKGILAALLFEDANDVDNHIRLLFDNMPTKDFIRYILGLRIGEPLAELIAENKDEIAHELLGMKQGN